MIKQIPSFSFIQQQLQDNCLLQYKNEYNCFNEDSSIQMKPYSQRL